MVRNFINYEDFIENNKLNIEINSDSPRLFIKTKNKKGLYKFEPIKYYNDGKIDIKKLIRNNNYNKKSILMVYLTTEESKLFDELFIKKYMPINNNEYKKVFEKKDDIIHLINFNAIVNMNISEINKGNIVALMPCIDDEDYYYISGDRSALLGDSSINNRRRELNKMKLGSDIYFHTEDEDILERYKNDITELKEIKYHTYNIVKHKYIVLDAMKNNDMIGFSSPNYYCLDMLLLDSIPIFINEDERGFSINHEEPYQYQKKGYIIDRINFDKLIKNSAIYPLLKFINVYEIDNGEIKKTSLEDYLKEEGTYKYIKKSNFKE